MKNKFLKLTASILTASLLLTGCGYSSLNESESDSPSENSSEDAHDGFYSITSTDGVVTNPGDNDFTLCWLKSESLNPFSNTVGENAAISSLMYEGLFTISPSFEAIPCLCTSYTVDGLTYTFNIKSGIIFHDGSDLTAYDVVYSIERAMISERFASRLECIESVSYVSELSLEITVKAENYTLPSLLDIPIVMSNTGGDNIPVGTGPYVYNRDDDESVPYLTAFADYRDSVPVDKIYLYDISNTTPAIAMSQRNVDFILHSPLEDTLNVYIDHNAHFYETTILQYIGFNTNATILSDSDIRRAISHLVNKELIANEVFDYNVTAAPLVLSPYAPGYTDMPENISQYSAQVFSSILNSKGAADSNGDGWLEVGGNTMTFTFIVNRSDNYKVKAAEKIASALQGVGIKINLKVLPYEEYLYALSQGNFDMYYAEVRLPANFDLSEILASYGSLNYGNYTAYDDVLVNYLAAETEEQKAIAARELCRMIYEKSPIIPICYNKNVVAVPRSEVQGVTPSQQYLFWDLSQWTVNLDQED